MSPLCPKIDEIFIGNGSDLITRLPAPETGD
jgi:hypothetical protein